MRHYVGIVIDTVFVKGATDLLYMLVTNMKTCTWTLRYWQIKAVVDQTEFEAMLANSYFTEHRVSNSMQMTNFIQVSK